MKPPVIATLQFYRDEIETARMTLISTNRTLEARRPLRYAEGVKDPSPGSRSAPWVTADRRGFTPKELHNRLGARFHTRLESSAPAFRPQSWVEALHRYDSDHVCRAPRARSSERTRA